MPMSDIVVLVTASSQEGARLARVLVEERLAACVNLVPSIASTYWWEGKIEEATEYLLIVKTRQDRLDRLIVRVRELHSYTVPEVIALPIVGGNPAYLQWMTEALRGT